MGRVLTNNTALNYTIETALGIAGTSWEQLEPNDITSFGASITTVAREPISKDRSRRKGTVTDLDSSVEFEHDLTLSVLIDFAEGFLFSNAVNGDTVFTAADVTATTGFTIPAATAAQAAKFQFTSGGPITLLQSRGYINTGNNGTFPLTTDLASTDTTLAATGVITTETAPTNAEVALAGIRPEAGDLALAVSGTIGTLTSGNNSASNNIDFTTLGLTAGQFIHIGGTADANRFGSTAAADGTTSYGYARVTSISAGTLLLDKLSTTLVASDGTDDGTAGTTVQTDLLYGRFVRNLATDDADFLERTYQFELALPNLDTGGGTMYEYSKGNSVNTVAINVPLVDKSTMTFGFVGTDTDIPTATRKTGAATATAPGQTVAFNTSSDVMRLRVTDVDENALTTCFKDFTLTLGNNVSPEKCIGTLGASFINTGNFDVDLEAQILLTEAGVVSAIRNNDTVTLDFILTNDDGGLAIDIPSLTLGGGDKELPINESVLVNLTGQAFNDATLGTSIGLSLFPLLPSA